MAWPTGRTHARTRPRERPWTRRAAPSIPTVTACTMGSTSARHAGGAHVDATGCPPTAMPTALPMGSINAPPRRPGARDVKGCPVDSDADGVPDGVDQCPNTPAGVTSTRPGAHWTRTRTASPTASTSARTPRRGHRGHKRLPVGRGPRWRARRLDQCPNNTGRHQGGRGGLPAARRGGQAPLAPTPTHAHRAGQVPARAAGEFRWTRTAVSFCSRPRRHGPQRQGRRRDPR